MNKIQLKLSYYRVIPKRMYVPMLEKQKTTNKYKLATSSRDELSSFCLLVEMMFISFKGCRGSPGNKPLASNCNACRYLKNAITGECLKECPYDMEKADDNNCKRKCTSTLKLD